MVTTMDLQLSPGEIAPQTRAGAFAHNLARAHAAIVDRDERYAWAE